MGAGTVDQGAQVKVVAAVTPNLPADSAGRSVHAFAAESALSVLQLFEDAGADRESDNDSVDADGASGGAESG